VAGQLDPRRTEKAALRREVLAARDALTAAMREAASEKISQQILALDAWKNARTVLAYLSFGSEFITDELITDAKARGKQLVLPRVDPASRTLVLHAVSDSVSEVQSGVWGIREPRPERPMVPSGQIDFVLVPGVAFTPACARLGYGGGFYDRLIAGFEQRPPLVAAAFALQMRDRLPQSSHDQGIDLVVTEDAVYCGC
jgi:5-formyltetrahydrofolate cyclo-ligase